ncbi:MAG: 23S rRNA (uracil(1939)-C(5))-methyltransferase RlmD [Ignavibacteriales bacterium]|nr:23S rRNA (uracil(1939)-C(5))-methyltransferase RlmD [Ignavibacteriales bacterium]
MKKRDVVELRVESYAFEGKGVARVPTEDGNQFVVFVHGAYPGDLVRAEIRRKRKRHAEAATLEILEPSPLRREPRCPHFGACGGCKQQNLDYEAQLRFKRKQVADSFQRIGGVENAVAPPTIPSENRYYYRNKMEFSFARRRWLSPEEIRSGEDIDDRFALGLHAPKVFDKVVDLDTCFLQSETSAEIVNFTRSHFAERGATIYSTKTHDGRLRHLTIRESEADGERLVALTTNGEDDGLLLPYADELKARFPSVASLVQHIHTGKAQIAIGERERTIFGEGHIHDNIGDRRFRISAASFFQTNTRQAETLYRTALEFAEPTGDEIFYDLYCGAGTISIFFADRVKAGYGFEVVESATKDARANAALNGVENLAFFEANLYKSFLPVVAEHGLPSPDLLLLDPPRGGMHPTTIADVVSLAPPKIVYVSCNPATQARDVKELTGAGYRLEKLQPVDMFPHTWHIENVARLTRE